MTGWRSLIGTARHYQSLVCRTYLLLCIYLSIPNYCLIHHFLFLSLFLSSPLTLIFLYLRFQSGHSSLSFSTSLSLLLFLSLSLSFPPLFISIPLSFSALSVRVSEGRHDGPLNVQCSRRWRTHVNPEVRTLSIPYAFTFLTLTFEFYFISLC